MKFSNKYCEYIAYSILFLLVLVVICYCFTLRYKVIKNLDFDFYRKINQNSNAKNVEGFSGNNAQGYKYKKDDDIYKLIERKLQGLVSELGGDSGKKETKQILVNTKKICNLECAKCMMNMIEENKGIKTIDLDKMLDDEDSENCIKCKKYTELSNSIKSVIDNL
tara:strand:- start:2268 stop:2762 length:495 start_codon:yes stop_codon:yes gene_type:complete